MRFCASSSELPDSPSQRQNINLRLGRSKISSAERLKYFTESHSVHPHDPVFYLGRQEAFSYSWMGKNQRCSTAEALKNMGLSLLMA